jgi:hypothetical protein
MDSKIVKRISGEIGIPELLRILSADLPLSDLQSLLLNVFTTRVAAMDEAHLFSRSGRGVVAPAAVDARLFHLVNHHAYDAAAAFEAVDLSPVCPLGLNHVLGGIEQNSVLSGIRGMEVLADPTTAMALECARRRRVAAKQRDAGSLRLCAGARVLRLQPMTQPGHVHHFRLFSLVTAGRDRGSSRFELESLRDHIAVYLRLFSALNRRGFQLTAPLVEISDMPLVRAVLDQRGADNLPQQVVHPEQELAEFATSELRPNLIRLGLVRGAVFEPLRAEFPNAEFGFNLARLQNLDYYNGLALRISPTNAAGQRYAIADGGFTDWTARLLQNRKERLLTSAIGLEFLCTRFFNSAIGR